MKKIFTKLGILLAVPLALAACGGETSSQEGGSTASSGSTVATGSMPDRPFVYVAQQVVGSVDPAKIIDETEVITAVNLYDPLVYPLVEESSMEPGPNLAENWEVSEDGLTYTFNLRDDVTFHSGNAFTAEDVVYSIERMLAINEGNAWLWNGVLDSGNTTAVDDYTVEFQLNNPYAPFISTMTQLFVVDSQLLKDNQEAGDFGEFGDYGQAYLENNTAGSGPYTLTNWDRESQLDFTAFEDYWKGWEDGQVQEAQMKILTEEATVKTLLVSGQADVVHQWLNITAFNEFDETDGIVVQRDPSAQLRHMPMNTQKAPTDDINVRKAIATAFDYTTATNDILGGSEQAEGSVPLVVPAHSDGVTVFEQDLEQAQQYLDESEYAGQDLTVTFKFLGDNPQQRQFAQLLQSNLGEIGITVELEPSTWPQITEASASIETTPNLMMISDTLKYPHVDSHTYGMYHPSTHGSYRSSSWYDNPEVTQILEQARQSTDTAEQESLYKEAQDLVSADAPSIYIANPTHHIAYRDYVSGYTFTGLMGYDISFYHFRVQ